MVAVFTDSIDEIIEEILRSVEVRNVETFMQSEIYDVIFKVIEEQRPNSSNLQSTKDTQTFEEFIIVSTGHGKTNMGAAFSKAISSYNIDKIIGVGNAGVIKDMSPIPGELTISTSTMQYDVNFSPIGTPAPMMIGVDMMEYPADCDLINLAMGSARKLNMRFLTLKYGSADKFMASDKDSELNTKKFNVQAFDTEAGVIGQAATVMNIPYVYVKGASNFADDDAPEMYTKYKNGANCMSQMVVMEMLKELTKA